MGLSVKASSFQGRNFKEEQVVRKYSDVCRKKTKVFPGTIENCKKNWLG